MSTEAARGRCTVTAAGVLLLDLFFFSSRRRHTRFDCDWSSDVCSSDLASLSEVPVVVFTGRELSAEEDAQLHTMARSIVVKGVESPERLLDETALFLH